MMRDAASDPNVHVISGLEKLGQGLYAATIASAGCGRIVYGRGCLSDLSREVQKKWGKVVAGYVLYSYDCRGDFGHCLGLCFWYGI